MFSHTTFVVVDCKSRKTVLVTSSARKAGAVLQKGYRIEVWTNDNRVETMYSYTQDRGHHAIGPYIQMEREYIGRKQAKAEQRNKRRKQSGKNTKFHY